MGNRNILVIGAGGQLGSELTYALRQLHGESKVIATDIKNPGGVVAEGRFEILDVLDQKRLFDIVRKNDVVEIYHLAAVLSATGEKNPKFAWHLNMDGLIHVLDAAVDCKVPKVYWPSSIAVLAARCRGCATGRREPSAWWPMPCASRSA